MIIEIEETRQKIKNLDYYFLLNIKWFISFLYLMLLTPISWANRVWALPFLTVLAPSQRYNKQQGKTHKKITDWARQMILQLSRWLPQRQLVIVADASYACYRLLDAVRHKACMIRVSLKTLRKLLFRIKFG